MLSDQNTAYPLRSAPFITFFASQPDAEAAAEDGNAVERDDGGDRSIGAINDDQHEKDDENIFDVLTDNLGINYTSEVDLSDGRIVIWRKTAPDVNELEEGMSFSAASGHPLDMEYYDTDYAVVQVISENVASFWSQLCQKMIWDLENNILSATAKVGTPLATTRTKVEPSAWKHFRIIDWNKGVARADNHQFLYDIYVMHAPSVVIDPAAPVKRGRKPIQRDAVVRFLSTNTRYANGKDEKVSWEAILADYRAWAKANREISVNMATLRRAMEEYKLRLNKL